MARAQSLDALRVEPYGYEKTDSILQSLGYEKRSKSSQPEVTRLLSLSNKTDDEVIAEMNATNRNLWRKNLSLGSAGVVFRIIKESTQAEVFLNMMHETAARSGATFHGDDYFRVMIDYFGSANTGGVMIASKDGSDLASTLFVIDELGKTLYYLHAGSTAEARQYNAGNVLVSNLIMYAKSLSMTHVDLYGVAPEDAPDSHPLYGISKFKRAYGGVDVSYFGTWEKSLTTKHKLTKKALSVIGRPH
jgi:lipid II:glycine glycyltransferase (peptidoglycan interpeptide bridge formation enzyme)